MTTAFSYLRYSTPEQMKGASFARQTKATDKYIADHNLTLDTTLYADLGVSAYKGKNLTKALGTFLTKVTEGHIPAGSVLIVESLDRLSRQNPLDAFDLFRSIIKVGITVVTLLDKQSYSNESIRQDPSQLQRLINIMQRAHEESVLKSERVRDGKAEKRQLAIDTGHPLTHITPSWIRIVDGKFELIPERVEIVQRIFTMARNGSGVHTIVATLNAEKVKGFGTGVWNPSFVHKVLRSISAHGSAIINGINIPDYFPAIIDKDDFNYISVLRSGRKTSQRSGTRKGASVSNLFSGLLYCGYCGSAMHMAGYNEKPAQGGQRVKTICCHGARTGKTKCLCIQWQYDDFEATFLFRTGNINFKALFGMEQPSVVVELEKQVAQLQAIVTELDRKIDNLHLAMAEEFSAGLAKMVKKLEDERDVVLADIAEAEKKVSAERMNSASGTDRKKLIMKLFQQQAHGTDAEKRITREALSEQIRMIVEKIVVFPTGPARDRAEKEMRYMDVYFINGQVVSMSVS